MKVIREVIGIMRQYRGSTISYIDPFSANGLDENLYYKFYRGVTENILKTDEEAARYIYNTHASNKKYLMLKSRLKERLYNTFLVLSPGKQDPEYQRAIYQSHRDYFVARTLLQRGGRLSAIPLAKSTLALAVRFDINEVASGCVRILRNHYALTGNKRELNAMSSKMIHLQDAIENERRMEIMYENLIIRFVKSRAIRASALNLARKYLKESYAIVKKRKRSYNVNLLHFRISIFYYQIIRDYDRLLKACQLFDKYIQQQPHFRMAARDGEIALLKLTCCLYLRDFKYGFANAETALRLFKEGGPNWFTVQEFHFLIAMHAAHYDRASEIYGQTTNHPRFQSIEATKKEEWKISEAYLNYAVTDQQKRTGFRIEKFLNEVDIFSKDKEGFYVSVLIAEILYLIERKKEDFLEHKVEGLRIYVTRHLSEKISPRTVYFVKMLRLLIHYHFYLPVVRKKAEKYYALLKETALAKNSSAELTEVIPYEDLWGILLARVTSGKYQSING